MATNPPNSRRGQIFNNLIRQLQTITTDNGYAQNVISVSYIVKTWAQLTEPETPALFIVDETSQWKYHAGQRQEVTWQISIYGVMKNKNQFDMEELVSDIALCLSKNVVLSFTDTGGVCSLIEIKDVVTDNQMFAEIDGSQLFKVIILVKYAPLYGQR